MKKTYRFFIVGVVLLLFADFSSVQAVKKLEYYTDLFESWGLTVFSSEFIADEKHFGDVELLSANDKFLLLFSSELSQLHSDYIYTQTDFNKIVVLCDVEYTSAEFFSCNNFQVNLHEGTKDVTFFVEEINTSIEINYLQNNGRHVFVIAENDLAIPDVRNVYESYFNSISKANAVVQKDRLVNISPLKQNLKSLLGSSLFLLFKQIFFVATLLIILKKFLLDIYYSPKDLLSYPYYVNKLRNFQESLETKKLFLLLLFAGTVGLYITLLSFVSLRQIAHIDENHIIGLINSSMRTSNLQASLVGGNMLLPSLFIINVLLIILLFLIVLPSVIDVLIFSLKSLFSPKKNMETTNGLVLFLINLSLVLLIVFELSQVYFVLSGLLLLVVYEIHKGGVHNFEVSQFVNNLKRLLFSGAVILFSFIVATKMSDSPVEIKYENLLPSDRAIIMLPYSKQNEENIMFNEFSTSALGPIFADNILIYHPIYSSVVTKHTSTFTEGGAYAILRPEKHSSYVELIKDRVIGEKLISDVPTTVFEILNFNSAGVPGVYKINLSIDCSTNSSAFDVKLFVSSEKETIEETFFSFPGCLGSQQNASYEIPVADKYNSALSEKDVLVELIPRNANKRLSVSSLNITKNSNVLPIRYINAFSEDRILYSQEESTSQEFIVYSVDINNEFQFNNNLEEQVNIAENVNILNKDNALMDPFVLWSPVNNLIVKNSL